MTPSFSAYRSWCLWSTFFLSVVRLKLGGTTLDLENQLGVDPPYVSKFTTLICFLTEELMGLYCIYLIIWHMFYEAYQPSYISRGLTAACNLWRTLSVWLYCIIQPNCPCKYLLRPLGKSSLVPAWWVWSIAWHWLISSLVGLTGLDWIGFV